MLSVANHWMLNAMVAGSTAVLCFAKPEATPPIVWMTYGMSMSAWLRLKLKPSIKWRSSFSEHCFYWSSLAFGGMLWSVFVDNRPWTVLCAAVALETQFFAL